jgi:hypothetical protein
MAPDIERQLLVMELIEVRSKTMTLEEILAALKSLESTTQGIITTSPRGVQPYHTGNFEMDIGQAMDQENIIGSTVIVDTGIIRKYADVRNAKYHFNTDVRVPKESMPTEMVDIVNGLTPRYEIELAS